MFKSYSPDSGINVEWTKDPLPIHDFIKNFDGPQIVKIHDGENKRLQIPGNFDLQQPILLYKVYTCRKIHGRSLAMDNQWQIKPAGPTLIIPDSYPGWVAVVKRDGRTAGHFNSVGEVSRASLSMFLTQDAVFGLKANSFGMSRVLIPSGTVLKILGSFEDMNRQSFLAKFKGCVHPDMMMYLKCVVQRGEVVFLPYSARGRFYCISSPESHTLNHIYLVSNLLRIAKTPTLVRIINGPRPHIALPFTNIVKLEEVRRETIILGCTMVDNEPILLEINANSEFSFLTAKNEKFVQRSIAYRRMCDLCYAEGDKWRQQIRVAHYVIPKQALPLRERTLTPSSLMAVNTHPQNRCRDVKPALPACETIDFMRYAYRDCIFPKRFWMFRRSKKYESSNKSDPKSSNKSDPKSSDKNDRKQCYKNDRKLSHQNDPKHCSKDDLNNCNKSEPKYRIKNEGNSRVPLDFIRSYYAKYKERKEPFKHCRDSLRLRSSKRFRMEYPRFSSSDDGYATSYLDDESLYHSIC